MPPGQNAEPAYAQDGKVTSSNWRKCRALGDCRARDAGYAGLVLAGLSLDTLARSRTQRRAIRLKKAATGHGL
jgi:hypothetical protein